MNRRTMMFFLSLRKKISSSIALQFFISFKKTRFSPPPPPDTPWDYNQFYPPQVKRCAITTYKHGVNKLQVVSRMSK